MFGSDPITFSIDDGFARCKIAISKIRVACMAGLRVSIEGFDNSLPKIDEFHKSKVKVRYVDEMQR